MEGNGIYSAVNRELVKLEKEGFLKGNTHHISQRIVEDILVELLSKQQRKVFDIVSTKRQTTTDISKIAGLSTKVTSSVLINIEKKINKLYKVKENAHKTFWYIH